MGKSDSVEMTERRRAEGKGVLAAPGIGESSENPDSSGEKSVAGNGLEAGWCEG